MGVLQALSPPVESKDDLVQHLAAGSKPREKWRIGTEHEKFAFRTKDLTPLPYEGDDGVSAILDGLVERYGWRPVRERGNTIALSFGQQTVTLEPGGQLELGGSPLATIHETCVEVNTHLRQVKAIGDDLGVAFLGVGFQPKWKLADIPVMPKQRYGVMRNYMPTKGTHGLDMMFRTSTVQVNLDFESEAEMVKKLRVSLALQPVATALFANSPFTEGRPNGYQSFRAHIWLHTDNDRTGIPAFVFEDGMSFERYTDWALTVPMYFVVRNSTYMPVHKQTFADFMQGRLDILPGERPTKEDWVTHLTTLFPEVRLKQYLEMRGCDGGPWARLCALPALWVGILYNPVALEAAWDLVKNWTQTEREAMYRAVPKHGLDAPAPGGRKVLDLAREVVMIAEDGLHGRGCCSHKGRDECIYLEPLKEIAATGRTAATILLEKFHGEWGGSVDPLFREYAY
ncbi:MAG: glutamate--cysteine ligase [Alphaproteobacteria bacterium]|nr:glutamate--cysteine ligase [Alphaproteobacteria bacterium]